MRDNAAVVASSGQTEAMSASAIASAARRLAVRRRSMRSSVDSASGPPSSAASAAAQAMSGPSSINTRAKVWSAMRPRLRYGLLPKIAVSNGAAAGSSGAASAKPPVAASAFRCAASRQRSQWMRQASSSPAAGSGAPGSLHAVVLSAMRDPPSLAARTRPNVRRPPPVASGRRDYHPSGRGRKTLPLSRLPAPARRQCGVVSAASGSSRS